MGGGVNIWWEGGEGESLWVGNFSRWVGEMTKFSASRGTSPHLPVRKKPADMCEV